MTTMLLALVLAQAPEPHARILHAVLAAHVVAQTVDVATTEYALGRGVGREANPAMRWAARAPVRMGLAKGGYAAASSWALLVLHKRHPRAALIAGIASTAVGVVVSARNARAIRPMTR